MIPGECRRVAQFADQKNEALRHLFRYGPAESAVLAAPQKHENAAFVPLTGRVGVEISPRRASSPR